MISKPHEYCHSYAIGHEMPYEVSGTQKGTHVGTGTLHIGRVVWVREAPPLESSEQLVSAYVEGVGVVSVRSNALHHISS